MFGIIGNHIGPGNFQSCCSHVLHSRSLCVGVALSQHEIHESCGLESVQNTQEVGHDAKTKELLFPLHHFEKAG